MLLFVLALALAGGATRARAGELDDLLLTAKAALEDSLNAVAQKQMEIYFQKAATTAPDPTQAEEAMGLLMRALHEQGKYAEMVSFLDARRVAQPAGDRGAAAFWRAAARYELGEFKGVLTDLDKYEERYPGSPYALRVRRLRAWCCLKSGKTDEALAEFAAIDKAADPAVAAENLLEWGKALLAAGRADQGLVVLDRLLKSGGAPRLLQQGRACLGQALMAQGRWAEATTALRTLAQDNAATDDLRAEAWFSLAHVFRTQTNAAQAVESLKTGIALARQPALKRRGMRSLGLQLVDLGRLDEGVPVLKEVVSSAPDDPQASATQLALADALMEHGSNEQAVVEYRHYAETFTNTTGQAQAAAGRGWALINLGRYAEAATAFLKAYDTFTDTAEKQRCLFKAGDAYFANAQYKLAEGMYGRMATEFPDASLVPQAVFQRGESLAAAGDQDAAETVLQGILTRYPTNSVAERALLRIGELREARGRLGGSLDAFTQLIETYTNGAWLADALCGRAKASYQLLRFQPALADFDRIVAEFPASPIAPEAYYWSGMCHYWMGRDEKALQVSRDFIKRYPQSKWASRAMFWVARYDFNVGAYAEAEKQFIAFADAYPRDPLAADALLWAGKAAALHAEYLRAVELLGRLVKEYPDSRKMDEARFAQGDALCNLAKFPEAILALDEVLNKYPDSDMVPATWMRKGDCQFMLGAQEPARYAEAIASFRAAANHSAATPETVLQAEYKTGRCLEKMGKTDDAVAQYYSKVVVRYLEAREKGARSGEASKTWFARACFSLADILEGRKEWRQVVSILERAIDSGVIVSDDTQERIRKIRAEHWWLFY